MNARASLTRASTRRLEAIRFGSSLQAYRRDMDTNRSSREFAMRLHQAQDMVSVQADCAMDEALRRIQERATLLGLTVEDTAADVLTHHIWFRPE